MVTFYSMEIHYRFITTESYLYVPLWTTALKVPKVCLCIFTFRTLKATVNMPQANMTLWLMSRKNLKDGNHVDVKHDQPEGQNVARGFWKNFHRLIVRMSVPFRPQL